MVMDIPEYDSISTNKLLNLLNITDGFLKLYDNCYVNFKKILDLDKNKKIRDDIFINIDYNSKESFIESIRENIRIIDNIKDKIVLKNNLCLYSNIDNINYINKNKFIICSGNINSYIQNRGSDYKILILNVKKDVNVLLSPMYLKLDGDKIILDEDVNPKIIINTSNIDLTVDDNVIVLSKFKSNLINKKDYKYVNKFDLNYKVGINKVIVEKRNLNE